MKKALTDLKGFVYSLGSGTIEVIERDDNATRHWTPSSHYVPHHIVNHEGKRGTLVYDASGKLKNRKIWRSACIETLFNWKLTINSLTHPYV